MLFDFSSNSQIRFIKLSDYCIAEFIMEPIGSNIFTTEAYYKLDNQFNKTKQIYNIDSALRKTGNIKDLSVVSINDNIIAYLDSEKIPNYTDFDANLTETVLVSQPVISDTVKLHFLTGFDFEDFSALIFSIRAKMNNGEQCILTNLLISPETISDILKFNSRPLYLGEGVYDRYIIFKIPSLRNINNDSYTSLTPENTFGYQITDGIGLVNLDPINMMLAECDTLSMIKGDTNNYQRYQVNQIYTGSLAQINELSDFGVHIAESIAGDYIEYFGIYNGGFPEELISMLNSRSADANWMLIHQLSVQEQVGSAFIKSSFISIYQEDSFDEPLLYRPILKYAHEAISASIDYTLRLFNKATGDQEIRVGSMTIMNPNKYGKKLNKIQLRESPLSNRIYNKIIQKNYDSNILFIEPAAQPKDNSILVKNAVDQTPITTTITKIEYVPMFYTTNNVSVAEKNQKITSINTNEIIAFGQGKLPIIITPFDNVIKFKIYTNTTDQSIPFNLNLNSKIKLVFNSKQNTIAFNNVNDQTKENLSEGEIMFKFSKDDSLKIISSSDRVFYITVMSSDGTETSLYSGQWYLDTERDIVTALYKDAISSLNTDTKNDIKIQEIIIKNEETPINNVNISNVPMTISNSNEVVNQTIINDVITVPGYVSGVIPYQNVSPIRLQKPLSFIDNNTLLQNIE